MFTRRNFIALSAGASLLALALPAYAQSQINVVASFSILGDMAKEVGGDHIALTTLVGPNGDAHVYEPSAADARAVAGADVLIVNGFDFEGWLPRLIDASEFKGTPVVATAGITPLPFAEEDEHEDADDHDHDHDHDAAEAGEHAHEEAHDDHDHEEHGEEGHHHHGANDPHAWQSLTNGIVYVHNIASAFSAADPANAEAYQANAEAYIAQLTALDTRIKAEIAAIPADHRKVVTSHDAFGYFQEAYGIEFIAPEGVSTESEASAADVAHIIEQIRDENINAVFVENITDTRLIDQISAETGVKVGGALFSDALSDANGPAPTYIKMFENNVSQIVAALSAD